MIGKEKLIKDRYRDISKLVEYDKKNQKNRRMQDSRLSRTHE